MKKINVFKTVLVIMLLISSDFLYSGTLTIHNKNCAAIGTQHVKVHVFVPMMDIASAEVQPCTHTWVTVDKHSSKSLTLMEVDYDVDPPGTVICDNYFHEAGGTTGGKKDVDGREDSSVTCKNDWARVCQCTKDQLISAGGTDKLTLTVEQRSTCYSFTRSPHFPKMQMPVVENIDSDSPISNAD